ncbi:hypothetical protein C5N13_02770 [Sinorhizobium meliloti]|nr:hypothetical protein C5N13_02770 [Sinorhizobium meliloti]RVN10512.1 hypothetical protein CN115_20455 [Sinorhizobium meliloti]RVO10362.1 hypothetical protein CN099_16065 [Sinorhizobium meliloti]
MFDSLPSSSGQIKAGTPRALAVTTAERASSFPDIPTITESGIPGYEIHIPGMRSSLRPTPQPVIARLNEAPKNAMAGSSGAETHGGIQRQDRGLDARGARLGTAFAAFWHPSIGRQPWCDFLRLGPDDRHRFRMGRIGLTTELPSQVRKANSSCSPARVLHRPARALPWPPDPGEDGKARLSPIAN